MTSATASEDAQLLRQDDKGVAWLTLNRPQARNSLSLDLIATLQAELDQIAATPSIRVVVLAANGPAFCAGHDLKEVSCADQIFHQMLFNRCSELMLSIRRLPQPVIACVQSLATAAGCQLVASCDLAVAARSARFATPGVHIGLFCSTPMVALTRNVQPKQAMQLLLTGDPIDANTALAYGLVSQVVEDEALQEETWALASKIAAKSGHTLRIGKEAFYQQLEMSEPDAYALTSEVMAKNLQIDDAKEGIAAFIEKRHPVWEQDRDQ
ncbi:enoyl-CoA hydratase [Nitrincola alkalilacustris]|uniref:enoyl-CoA hydratase n=1 Tax=Nitrincola alkalilacustris TaxID=1571224 RepID=UPI00124D4DA7|nr:enoyl-CoA hydratase [Nitrincola alkalilacustris]